MRYIAMCSIRSRGHWIIPALATLVLDLATSAPSLAFDENDLKSLLDTKVCNGCDLEGADLRGRALEGAKLRWSNLKDADLRGANLNGADMTGASLEHAKLSNANFQGAKLEGARLLGVDLSEVRLIGADLRWADLRHLDVDLAFEFVELIGVQLEGARFKHGVRCAGFPAKGGWGCVTK
ncbi:MAG: pentapeptide repeat-containing protein [Acidiferrobacterales bacterium]